MLSVTISATNGVVRSGEISPPSGPLYLFLRHDLPSTSDVDSLLDLFFVPPVPVHCVLWSGESTHIGFDGRRVFVFLNTDPSHCASMLLTDFVVLVSAWRSLLDLASSSVGPGFTVSATVELPPVHCSLLVEPPEFSSLAV